MRVGERAEVERVFTQADFDRFAELSGDDNPIHVDEAFARTTRFGGTLCHGMLLFSALSAAIGSRFPGALLIDQSLKFPGPTFAGDRCVIRLEVLERSERTATLSAVIDNERGHVSMEGKTRVQIAVGAWA